MARRDGKALHPHTNYYVGGNTKFYGAALFRLRREDFGEIKHHGGVSPAWPISYDELEPYYTQAEQQYHVHGERGEDPTDPSSQRTVSASGREPRAAHPAAERRFRAPRTETLSHASRRACWTRRSHASKCIRCSTCDGFPCLVYAKSDAQVLGVDPALEYPNVRLMTNAYVERLETSASGRDVTRCRGPPERCDREVLGRHRGGLVRRDQFRGTAAAIGE